MTEHIESEISSQPECWKQAVDFAPDCVSLLPQRGERSAVVGCGTSLYVAQSYAALREASGMGETNAFTPSEMPYTRPYDRLVAITRSGFTTEIIELIESVAGRYPVTVVTSDGTTPAASAADHVIELSFANENSVVQTRFPTSTVALFRSSLDHDQGNLIADGEASLLADLDDTLLKAEQITFLGQGWTIGLAHEAALKMRETAGVWTESYPAMEYRHGPISISSPGRVVWMFGPPAPGLPQEVAMTGAWFETSTIDPLAELVRVQRLAVAAARSRGLDADNPRHLTRSVILTD